MERFHDAYVAELDLLRRRGRRPDVNPCPPAEALEALYIAEACELSRTAAGRWTWRRSARSRPGP